MEWCKYWIEYKGDGECPPQVAKLPCMIMVDGVELGESGTTTGEEWVWRKQVTHYKIPQADYERIYGGSDDDKATSDGSTASDILSAAAGHMQDRASTYDAEGGERSMGNTVQAFNAITGQEMSEEQGWLFMVLLKAVRSQQGEFRVDSYEDGAAYFALQGEAAKRDRGGDK